MARAFVDRGGQVPQLQIEIDRARAARYGLNVADVEDVIETALGGKTATEIWEGERQFPWSSACGEDERRDPDGDPARPGRHARAACAFRCRRSPTCRVGSGSMNIARESGTRVAAIGVFIQGRDMGSVVERDAAARRSSTCTLPPGYYATWGGEFENQQRAMARLEPHRAASASC